MLVPVQCLAFTKERSNSMMLSHVVRVLQPGRGSIDSEKHKVTHSLDTTVPILLTTRCWNLLDHVTEYGAKSLSKNWI